MVGPDDGGTLGDGSGGSWETGELRTASLTGSKTIVGVAADDEDDVELGID